MQDRSVLLLVGSTVFERDPEPRFCGLVPLRFKLRSMPLEQFAFDGSCFLSLT